MSTPPTQLSSQYTLLKYQPSEILLMRIKTKKIYRYLNQPSLNTQFHHSNQICHPSIQNFIRFQSGILFPKEQTTLKKELFNKRKSNNITLYTETELINTFTPLLEAIKHLHTKQIPHNSISSETVIVDQDSNIKLRNYLEVSTNPYYPQKVTTLSNDMRALGFLLLQCLTLKSIQQIVAISERQGLDKVFKDFKYIEIYSKGIIYGIIALINRMSRYLPKILSVMNNLIDENEIGNDLKDFYDKIMRNRQKERGIGKIRNETKNVFQHIRSMNNEIETLSIKKSSKIHTSKKLIKVDNTENKTFNEQIKKKQMQKISKMNEKSKVFASQITLNKKNNNQVKTKISQIRINNSDLKNQGLNIKNYKQSILTFSSDLKRLRSYQKTKETF